MMQSLASAQSGASKRCCFSAADARKVIFGVKKNEKRMKKIESEQCMYMNPFITEPSLTVAEHKAHSHALSKGRERVLSAQAKHNPHQQHAACWTPWQQQLLPSCRVLIFIKWVLSDNLCVYNKFCFGFLI
jgi:hypothetical protein